MPRKKKFSLRSNVGVFRRLRYNARDYFVGYVVVGDKAVSAILSQVRGKLNYYYLTAHIPCEHTYKKGSKMTEQEKEIILAQKYAVKNEKALNPESPVEEFFDVEKGSKDLDFDDLLSD